MARRRKILSFFVKWLKSEYGRQDIVANKEAQKYSCAYTCALIRACPYTNQARVLLNTFCKIESERPDANTVTKVLLKQLQGLVGVGGATRSVTEPGIRKFLGLIVQLQ